MNPHFSIARMRQFAPLALVLLSAVIAVGAYLQALDYLFISDDKVYLTDNTKLAELPLTELWRLFTEPYNTVFEFLPLRTLSYWFDMALFGLNPSAFRIHNILLYLLCLLLVYATTLSIWRYFRPAYAANAPWAAAAVTALFALHPALVESVVWISGRKYVLPNMFSMLALWLAVKARQEHGLSAPHTAAALMAFVAVMLSKASYVAVAPVIAMLWVLFWLDIQTSIPVATKTRKAKGREVKTQEAKAHEVHCRHYSLLLWPLAILLLAALLTMIFIASNKGFDRIPPYYGIEAVTRTLAVLGWLARLAVSPENRHFFYPVFEDPYLPAMITLGVAVLSASVVGGVMLLRKRSLECFALLAFLLLCMPYLQLIPHGAPSLVSDRYLALAVWPVILLIVALSWRLKPVPRTALLLAIALPWGFQTIERPRDWRSNETLIDADLRAYPGYYMPAFKKIMGIQLPQGLVREASETANSITIPELRNIMIKLIKVDHAVHVDAVATGKPQEAMNMLLGLELDLQQVPVQAKWNSPIKHLWAKTRSGLTMEWHSLAERFPDDVSVRYTAGLSLLNFHKYKEAALHLHAATESQHLPESVRGAAFYNLGFALMNSGHVAEAEAPLRAALEQSTPDMGAYCLLSEVYKYTNRLEEAARAEADCRSHFPNEEMAQ